MTKYSAPSIEVVTFNPADAPRIGMQWWALGGNTGDPETYFAVPNFTPTTLSAQLGTLANIPEMGCTEVGRYYCYGENIPGARDLFLNSQHLNLIADDGTGSC